MRDDIDALLATYEFAGQCAAERDAVARAERPTFTVYLQGVTYEQNYATTRADAERMALQHITGLGYKVDEAIAVERQSPVIHTKAQTP